MALIFERASTARGTTSPPPPPLLLSVFAFTSLFAWLLFSRRSPFCFLETRGKTESYPTNLLCQVFISFRYEMRC